MFAVLGYGSFSEAKIGSYGEKNIYVRRISKTLSLAYDVNVVVEDLSASNVVVIAGNLIYNNTRFFIGSNVSFNEYNGILYVNQHITSITEYMLVDVVYVYER